MELLNKYDEVKTGTAATSAPAPPREPTPLEMGAEVMEGVDSGAVVVKKIFKLGGSSLLVRNALHEAFPGFNFLIYKVLIYKDIVFS